VAEEWRQSLEVTYENIAVMDNPILSKGDFPIKTSHLSFPTHLFSLCL
jgi:hypothetical protein